MITLSLLLAVQSAALSLEPMPSGLFKRIGGYLPFGVKLSPSKPKGVTKTPEGSLRYGIVTAGGKKFVLALDGDKLYVDSNGDGDLTDDPASVWALRPSRNGEKATHDGTFTLDLAVQGKTVACTFGVYETPDADSIGYYADSALAGKITLGGKSYDAIYNDPYGLWDGSKGYLMIDKDHDGKFHPGYEFYPVDKPFNIAGTTYELHSVGGQPVVEKSKVTVAEKTLANSAPADPNLANGLRAGKNSLPFTATTTSGRQVSLPSTYKGSVVMVDFWATWCGPCMREVPNVVKAYGKFHGKGFEVLGVSLDRPKAEDQIKAVTAKQGMTWDQIYDGKFFEAAIAKQYKIAAIPVAYLVDGDTGKILASGDDLRGAKLEATLARVLASKKSAPK